MVKTKKQKAEEEENRRHVNETLRSCGYTNVRDNPGSGRPFCALCGREESPDSNFKLRHCAGCKKVAYCAKACQTKDWPKHKIDCDERLEKLKQRKLAMKRRFDEPKFKDLTPDPASKRDVLVSLAPPTTGTIWAVVDPELFGVIPDAQDDPLEYHLLSTLIQDFVERKAVFTALETPSFGELVIAKCVDEDIYARAVVVKVATGRRRDGAGVDDERNPAEERTTDGLSTDGLSTDESLAVISDESRSAASGESAAKDDLSTEGVLSGGCVVVVDLWFIDAGGLQLGTASAELIPIRDFWDDLHRVQRTELHQSLKPQHFVDLPARLVPCFLQATDPDTGKMIPKMIDNGLPIL